MINKIMTSSNAEAEFNRANKLKSRHTSADIFLIITTILYGALIDKHQVCFLNFLCLDSTSYPSLNSHY
jgi:hypothetical protein